MSELAETLHHAIRDRLDSRYHVSLDSVCLGSWRHRRILVFLEPADGNIELDMYGIPPGTDTILDIYVHNDDTIFLGTISDKLSYDSTHNFDMKDPSFKVESFLDQLTKLLGIA